MSLYFVRWYAPGRAAPLVRDFHSKREAQAFHERLEVLAEPPKRYADDRIRR